MSPAKKQPEKQPDPPQKQVLLLSCMDLRLADDTTRFMDQYNLQNRYDHLTFAGAAMGARNLSTKVKVPGLAEEVELRWRDVFFDHLRIAIEGLRREIKDIFLVEHFDCGAYKKLHPTVRTRIDYERKCATNMEEVYRYHQKEAYGFASDILKYCDERRAVHQTSIELVEKKIREGLSEVEMRKAYKDLFELETLRDAWVGMRVRSYVLDLKGKGHRL